MSSRTRLLFALLLVVALAVGLAVVIQTRRSAVPEPYQRAGAPSVVRPLLPAQLPAAPPKTPAISATNSVRIEKRAFTPAATSVKPGTLVTWTNLDLSPHTVAGNSFSSGVLSQGSVWSNIFTTPGRYEYHCSIHPTMRGVVEVR